MEEEDEICRVCRSEATPEQPLFHPCKCSGSIRYVHQDCLIEWLSHSGKKYCELCEHPFTFTPVYRQDMPEAIPAKLFILQLLKKLKVALKVTSRAALVSFVWLIILPYFTIWIWRLYFFLGTNLSQRLTNLQQQLDGSDNLTTTLNMTTSNTTQMTWFQEYKSQFTVKYFLSDCFKGQLIDCVVFVTFVAVFLLREWIVQNIPMNHDAVNDQPIAVGDGPQEPIVIEDDPQEPIVINDDSDNNDMDHNMGFDNHAFDQGPPSPVAEEPEYFLEDLPSNYTSNRASSVPPILPSFDRNHNFSFDDQPEFRRAMSLDPDYVNERHNSVQPALHRGQPPYAPRIRHAEARRAFRPILEEEEIPPPPPPQPPIAENNDDDEEEDNLEEMDGILEAIGMHGSLWSLAQSCALMALLIALSLATAVWMPYLIGMIFIKTDVWDFIRVPLMVTRLLTDPLVDFLFLVCTDYIGPFITEFYQHYLEPLSIFQFIPAVISFIAGQFAQDNSTRVAVSNDTSLLVSIAKFINETEPLMEDAIHRYQSLASGQRPTDRIACIFIGYLIITAVSCWYLSHSNNMATAAFGRTVQEALRHQGIICKVGMFIAIELAVFPVICGYLLDFSTIPLFNAATIATRIASARDHPVPSLFLHWFFGTSFMFTFAVLVNVCREVVRPGVMWFIRDPNDPEFHPIKEIIERPILTQFKKIMLSAAIYMAVIVIGVGGVVGFIHRFIPGFLPLKWILSNSLSVLPIDLIVMQVGLPALVRYTRPKQTLKRIFVKWVALTCRQLRLTSFMLGGRHPQEEGRLVYKSWSAWIRRVKPFRYPDEGTIDHIVDSEVSYVWEGRLLKVPRHDSVEVFEHRRMLVPLDNYTLEPLDMMERRLGHPAARAPGGDELNTTIVYSPPHFKERLWFFVCFMWISMTVFLCAAFIVPIMFGRFIFKHVLIIENDVHDMYSFIIGGSIILGIDVIINQLIESCKEVLAQTTLQETAASISRQAKQWGSWTIRWAFFVVTFGLLIPLTFGALIELYFILPMRQLGEDSPSMEVLSIWAHGFVFMNVIHGFIQIFPNNPIREVVEDVFQGGIHQMKLELCLKRMLAPLFVMSVAAIGLPFITAYINMKITALTNPELRIKILQIAYPTALVGFGSYYLVKLGSRIGTRLAQNIREDNYLIGRTLHNLE